MTTNVIHLVEDIFAETALAEARDFTISKGWWQAFLASLEKTFMLIAFAEAGEYFDV